MLYKEKICVAENIEARHRIADNSETCLRCGNINYIPKKQGVHSAFVMKTVLAKRYGLRVDVTGLQGKWILHFNDEIHAKRFYHWVRQNGVVMSDDAIDYAMEQFQGKE